MKTSFLLLLFCCSSLLLFAQKGDRFQEAELTTECGTPDISDEEFLALPWVGDNDNLIRAIQEKEEALAPYLNSRRQLICPYVFGGEGLSSNTIINVPVYFYVYKELDETGLPNNADINGLVNYTNSLFESSGSQIRLSIHCTRYPVAPEYVEISDGEELDDMMEDRGYQPGINIHVVDDGYGWGGVYNASEDGIAILRSTVNSFSETLAHEVGHLFTLPHTHKSTNRNPLFQDGDGLNVPCFREAVSRDLVIDQGCFLPFPFPLSNCNRTGDGFCDTAADPNARTCPYTGTLVDFLGVPYTPDVTNIMSYYSCRATFSPMQVNAMWLNLLSRLGGDWNDMITGSVTLADNYERNETANDATVLPLDNEQIHTLHGRCGRDRDWFVIEPGNVLGNYTIHVEKLPSCIWPVGGVAVFYRNSAGNIVELAAADIVELSDKFTVNIGCEYVSNEEIFIRVRNTNKPRGPYRIYMEGSELEVEIEGPVNLCQGNEYEVTGIPSGASVTWNPAAGLTFTCQTCNPTTVQSVSGFGSFNIGATVIHNGCEINLDRKVFGGEESTVPVFGIVENLAPCIDKFGGSNGIGQYTLSNTLTGVTYNWSVSNGWVSPSTGTSASVTPSGIGPLIITVTGTAPCATDRQASYAVYVDECAWFQLNLSPNPTKDLLRVEIEDALMEETDKEEYLIIVNDLYGEVLYQSRSDIKDFNLDVSGYKEGVYSLRVLRGETYISTNFVVSRD